MRCNGSGGLYGGDVEILYGPGIAGDAFRFLYKKSGGLVTSFLGVGGEAGQVNGVVRRHTQHLCE
jgi:hypothetical protein